MIELLSRSQTLALNKTFAAYIVQSQDIQYNPAHEQISFTPGQPYYDPVKGEAVTYSRRECKKLNDALLKTYNENKDSVETETLDGKYAGTSIFNFPPNDIDSYVETLAEGMVEMSEKLGWLSVFVLPDYSIPWLKQENDYAPVKRSLSYLQKVGVANDFAGGLNANEEDLKTLMKNLFWIFRCNASQAYCFLSAPEKALVIYLCQYGNLHFHFYSEQCKTETKKCLDDMGLIEVNECVEPFSASGSIEGRQMKLK
jgi:hypothetical protein